ncbi:MAG: rubrerythrin family protein [Nitrososphaerota archaeon]|nr:rubrerythrin family protein [Candidatus Bathyarchaeota archaeon]MCX8162621.1 rubrerythrin family protein [Candidatus Bathyarchaeota archaeon]MDW8061143.1 rubrerythrin family protein [Nitrososphaerota archaeon]
MRKMTEDNLKAAFKGESQAHMRYLIFAIKAEREGFANIARLFRAVAFAEQIHALNHLNTLGLIRSTTENLQVAIDGEHYEVNEMYPAYDSVAKLQGERNAERSFNWALQSEKTHVGLYQKAKQAAEKGEDLKIEAIYVCEICGYTIEDEVPDRCPICGAPKGKFVKF